MQTQVVYSVQAAYAPTRLTLPVLATGDQVMSQHDQPSESESQRSRVC